MTTTVADAYLATRLAVPNVKARLSPAVKPTDQDLTTQDHVVRLSNLHPDERLSYLADIGLTAEEVDAVSQLVEDWLSPSRRGSLDEAAEEACRAGEGLDSIMEAWGRTGPYEALALLIEHMPLTQREPVLCYAVCAATELAWAMLIVHEFDSDRKPLSGGPDAMWADEDQEIAMSGLLEDVSQWPE